MALVATTPRYEEEGRDYPIGYVRWTERRLVGYFFEEVAAGRVKLGDLVTHEFPITEAEDAYGALSESGRMAILLRYPPAIEGEAPQRRAVLTPQPIGGGRLRVALIGPESLHGPRSCPCCKTSRRATRCHCRNIACEDRRSWGPVGRFVRVRRSREVIDDPGSTHLWWRRGTTRMPTSLFAAMEQRKAVFVEKPLALTHAQLDRLQPLLDGGGRLVVDFNRSVAPATRAVLEHFCGRADPLQVGVRVNAGFLPGAALVARIRSGVGDALSERVAISSISSRHWWRATCERCKWHRWGLARRRSPETASS